MHKPEHIHYVAHTVIIYKGGKYLITQRSHKEKFLPGSWLVPGGRANVKDYERTPDTKFGQWYNTGEWVCQREVKEEVGLHIPIDEIRYVTSISFKHPDDIFVFMNSYLVVLDEDDEQEVVLNEEIDDFKWVTLEEAKEYEMIPGVWEEIEMADRIIKGETIGAWESKE